MTTFADIHNDFVKGRWYESESLKQLRYIQTTPLWYRILNRVFNGPYKFDPPVIDLRKYARGMVDRYQDNCIDKYSRAEWYQALDDITAFVEEKGGRVEKRHYAIDYFNRMYQYWLNDNNQTIDG